MIHPRLLMRVKLISKNLKPYGTLGESLRYCFLSTLCIGKTMKNSSKKMPRLFIFYKEKRINKYENIEIILSHTNKLIEIFSKQFFYEYI
jgi:hypothetical protein